MSKDQIKYAEMNLALSTINMRLEKDEGFVKHLKRLAKLNEEEFLEEVAPNRARKRRLSRVSKSPDNSPTGLMRSTLHSKAEFKGFKKLALERPTKGSISPSKESITKSKRYKSTDYS